MKKKKLLLLAFALAIVMTAAFIPHKAYASSTNKIVSYEPTKVGGYYYKIDFDKNDSYRNLYRSKYKNKGYKCIAKHILEIWDFPVCAVDGKYAYIVNNYEDPARLIQYSVSKTGKKVVKKRLSGYWNLGAAKGNALLLEGRSGIYRYDTTRDTLKKIKSNIDFAEIPAQYGNYVMLRAAVKGEKRNHYIYRITDSGQLKKVRKIGTIKFNSGGEIPYSEYHFVGKKIYYMMDNRKSYVFKKCDLNGSNAKTLRVFHKSDNLSYLIVYDWTGKNCKINLDKNNTIYVYKYTYKTNKLKLIEKY